MSQNNLKDLEKLKSVLRYLSTHNILTMATASKNGEPNATALEYANKGLIVYVSVFINSQKIKFIKENPKVFYEIHDDIKIEKESLKKLEALQVSAEPFILDYNNPADKEEYESAFKIMMEKYPIFAKLNKKKRVILKFIPKTIFYLNYRDKLFHRDVIPLNLSEEDLLNLTI